MSRIAKGTRVVIRLPQKWADSELKEVSYDVISVCFHAS